MLDPSIPRSLDWDQMHVEFAFVCWVKYTSWTKVEWDGLLWPVRCLFCAQPKRTMFCHVWMFFHRLIHCHCRCNAIIDDGIVLSHACSCGCSQSLFFAMARLSYQGGGNEHEHQRRRFIKNGPFRIDQSIEYWLINQDFRKSWLINQDFPTSWLFQSRFFLFDEFSHKFCPIDWFFSVFGSFLIENQKP